MLERMNWFGLQKSASVLETCYRIIEEDIMTN